MAESTVAEVVDFLRKALVASGVSVHKLVVFGSRARGEGSEDSDLDIAVVSSSYEGRDIFERVRLAKKAVMATADRFVMPLDIAHLTPEEYEARSSPIASFAHEGEEIDAR